MILSSSSSSSPSTADMRPTSLCHKPTSEFPRLAVRWINADCFIGLFPSRPRRAQRERCHLRKQGPRYPCCGCWPKPDSIPKRTSGREAAASIIVRMSIDFAGCDRARLTRVARSHWPKSDGSRRRRPRGFSRTRVALSFKTRESGIVR